MKAVFLDRDGTINADRDDYVKDLHELTIYSFAPAAIRSLNEAGWPVFVVSNQQGVAKGIIAETDLANMEREITRRVEAAGGRISGFYYCKHLASDMCGCRKPQPGLLLQAASEHGVDLGDSVMVGDTQRDVSAGRAAGCATILVLTGKLTRQQAAKLNPSPDWIADDLEEAASIITSISADFGITKAD